MNAASGRVGYLAMGRLDVLLWRSVLLAGAVAAAGLS